MIALDTSVLFLAFRRRAKPESEPSEVAALRKLIEEDRPIVIPGIVLQEFLSGVRTIDQFNRLRSLVYGFPILAARKQHHIAAADIANRCRWAGVSVSTIDCLIAAQALGASADLFTSDADFEKMAPHCGLKLYNV